MAPQYKQINTYGFRLTACAISGILSSLPFIFEDLFLLEWILISPYFFFMFSEEKMTSKSAFLYGFAFNFSKTFVLMSFLYELRYLSSLDLSISIICIIITVGIALISALQSAIFGLFSILIRKISELFNSSYSKIIYSSLLFTLFEITLTLGTLAFPWNVTYITQASFLPMIQSSSIFGAYFVSFIVLLFNAAIAVLLIKKTRLDIILFACVIMLSNIYFGSYTLGSKSQKGDKLKITIYQDNKSSYDKWSSSSLDAYNQFASDYYNNYERFENSDIILLSETIFTTTFYKNKSECPSRTLKIQRGLENISLNSKSVLVAGAFGRSNGKQYNCLYAFENAEMNDSVYSKRSLVPFGEFIPFGNVLYTLFPALRNFNLSGNQLTPGESGVVFETEKGVLGALVCFDSMFPQNSTESVSNGAEIILLSTNDSWYNDSYAIYRHLDHARFRAIESGRYVIRCATTGVSSIIDEKGRITSRTDILTKQILQGEAVLLQKNTFFNNIGFLFVNLAVVILIFHVIIVKTKEKRKSI